MRRLDEIYDVINNHESRIAELDRLVEQQRATIQNILAFLVDREIVPYRLHHDETGSA